MPIVGGKSTLLFDLDEGLTDTGDGSLSPDGSLVTFLAGGQFESRHCGPCRFVANADGTNKILVSSCFHSNPAGTWSPDGSRIVCREGPEDDDIVLIGPKTRSLFRVAEGSAAIWLDDQTLLIKP